MGRLKALVSHAQQAHATRDATAKQPLLHVAHPRECDTQQIPVRAAKDNALPDSKTDTRQQRLLAMLRESPDTRYAVLTDTDSDPDAVILALAIRGRAMCELLIPRNRYDGTLLLDLIERHGATVH